MQESIKHGMEVSAGICGLMSVFLSLLLKVFKRRVTVQDDLEYAAVRGAANGSAILAGLLAVISIIVI